MQCFKTKWKCLRYITGKQWSVASPAEMWVFFLLPVMSLGWTVNRIGLTDWLIDWLRELHYITGGDESMNQSFWVFSWQKWFEFCDGCKMKNVCADYWVDLFVTSEEELRFVVVELWAIQDLMPSMHSHNALILPGSDMFRGRHNSETLCKVQKIQWNVSDFSLLLLFSPCCSHEHEISRAS